MSINQMIAQGLAPIGRDLPEIGNMLMQRRQAETRNALAEQAGTTDRLNAEQYRRSLDMQSQVREQDIAAQRKREARDWLTANYDRIRQQPQMLPQLVQFAKQNGYLDPAVPDDVPLEQIAGMFGVQAPQAPVPFEQTDEYKKLALRNQYDVEADRRRAANDAALERLRQSGREGTGDGMKPPPGYRFNPDGSLSAIPGGPADTKAGIEADKAKQRAANAVAGSDIVLETINDAIKNTKWTTAGLVGTQASKIKGTDAYDLEQKLLTIKANIGFDRLQQMREASPTGGALGQVAVQELNALQATIASLDQGQSRGQLREALKRIQKHYTNWNTIMKQASGQQQDAPGAGAQDGPVDYEFVPGQGLVRAGR